MELVSHFHDMVTAVMDCQLEMPLASESMIWGPAERHRGTHMPNLSLQPCFMLPCPYGSKPLPHHILSRWLAKEPRAIKARGLSTWQKTRTKAGPPPFRQDKFHSV